MRSVVSDSLWPCGPSPARLLCPWGSAGKPSGVGCQTLLQEVFTTRHQTHSPYVSCLGRFFSTSTFHPKKEKKAFNPWKEILALPVPSWPMHSLSKHEGAFWGKALLSEQACLAQACSDSLLFRNGNIRSLLALILQWHSGTCRSLSFSKRKKFPKNRLGCGGCGPRY